ncbi:T9SS type A sorting domain-containing protein [Arcicella lustrica]|uniref:T9SS type A sorting domain-containing protein n=1 Tax=Arcicella lustrica TaxID=2984196 RepID=A0ABU5SJ86_9BACT|nr:T9SS type A sorting domain-containing protein [Arcicella sp. DC25W]MEA5427362.1 T9SS type A sorting domain-containing protein [Arcicella sp. DC25W]
MKTRIFLSLMLLICFCLSVTQAQNINRVEYFIDQDPGFGKGTALVINPNIVVSGTYSIPLSSMEIPNGLHLLAVRAKDVNNNWSVTSISTFMKDNITSATPLSYISYAEYFIDNDPGFGKGTTVNLEKSSQINNFSFTIPLAQDLPKGVHYLNFRVRDLSGKWSVVAIKPIFKEDSPLEMTLSNIAKVEYFIDKDPGFGKGYDVAFTTGTNINNLSFTANLSGVLSGEHQMFIRVKDTKGNWSSVGLRKFTLCNDATSIKINVPSSTTVCQGQSIQLSVPSGYRYQWQKNGNNIYDAIANTYQVTESGQYQVAIVNNSCLFTSNAVDIVVTAFPEKPSLPVNSVGICAGNSIVLDANGCDGILTWYDGNNIVNKLVSPSVTTNYRATCTKNGCTSEKSDILKVTVNTLLSAPIISSSSNDICQGTTITLTASGCNGIVKWNDDSEGNTLTVKPNNTTTYSAFCKTNNCTSTNTSIIIKVKNTTANQTVINADNQTICNGSTVNLSSSGCTGSILWSTGAITKDITVSPSVNTTYSVICTQNNCIGTSVNAVKISVIPSITALTISAKDVSICKGKSTILSAGFCYGVTQWNNGDIGRSITVSPTISTTYTAVCLNNGCSSSVSNAIKINVSECENTAISITAIEYFIDKDPGLGKGTNVSITNASAITKDFNVSLPSTLSDGIHTLSVRAKDSKGSWTSVAIRPFVKQSLSQSILSTITQLEYFYDKDPGYGKGTQITVAKQNTIDNLNITLPISSSLSDGLHFLTIRAKDSKNSWGVSATKVFLKNVISNVALSNLTQLEYFVDIDPGNGKGIGIPFTSGQTLSNFTFDVSLKNLNLRDGEHFLQLRAKDNKGNWSSVGTKIFQSSNELVSIGSVANSYCNQQTVNIPYTVKGTFESDNEFIVQVSNSDGLFGDYPTEIGRLNSKINASIASSIPNIVGDKYRIRIKSTNPVRYSDSKSIVFKQKPNRPTISNGSAIDFCKGGNVILSASSDEGNIHWSNGLISTQINASKVGEYYAISTLNGCSSDISNIITVTNNVPSPLAPLISSTNAVICSGQTAILRATGCLGTVIWSNGTSGININVSPTITTKYKAICSVQNCISDSSLATTITVLPKPTQPKITVSNVSICAGGSSVLTSSACTGGVLSWTGGLTGNSITVSPTVTKTYKALCTVNGCKSDSSLATSITVISKPTQPKITASNATVCAGSSSILTATACTGGTLTWTGGLTGVSITVSPTVTKTYKALCTVNGCKSDSSLATTITVVPKPIQPIITARNSSICVGGSSVLTATACTNGVLTWTGGLTGNSITISPTATKSYKVLCTINGCKSDSSLATTITILPKPIQPIITASNSSICVGGSSVLTSSACVGGTLTWTSGLTGNSITVSPTSTRSYKALCTINGCKSDSSLATTITVVPKPTQPKITASNSSICVGGSSILTSTACTNGVLTWTGGLTGNSITISPTATKSYKVLCTINGCKSDSSLATTITVVPKPTQPKITASNSSICVGGSSVLTSTACTNGVLTWTGGLTGSSITVSPTVTKTYKVLCTVNGCKSDSSLASTITVTPKPTQPKITASNSSICVGGSSILTSTACTNGTLTWTGGLTGNSITVSPTATKSYKVLCTIGSCKSDSSLATTVTVTSKPIQPKITAINSSICVGENSVLTSTACVGGTLTWTDGLTGSSITISPTVTKTYKVLCTIGGCKSDSSLVTTITVTPKPTQPKITASNSSICVGGSSVLTSTACVGGTLTWTGGLTGNSITVSPTSTKSYKVLCTINGCKSDSSLATTITVVPKPSQPKITASNSSICVGGSSVLTATACTNGTLTWTGGLTGNSITVSPTVTKTYKVLCTVNGCKSDSSLASTITVTPKPTQPKITASNSSICVGGSSILTSTACTNGILTWTGGLTGNSITVLPTATKSYKVLCTIGSCKSDSSLATTINVLPKPTQPKITASNSSICVGGNSVLTSTACTGGTLTWTDGLTGSSITISPTVTKTHKVLCTIGGCKSDSSLVTTITVTPKPTQPKITASNSSICVGGSSVLTSTACVGGTLTWTDGLTGSSITISPTVTKTYKVLCTIGGCKSDSSLVTTITVTPKPTQPKITASNSSICVGGSSVLTSTACVGGTLTWTGGLTGNSITVSPTSTKSYKVLCTINGCKSDSSLATTITVVPKPSQPKITASNSSICVGGSSVLTATACTNGTLTWTGGLTGNSITVSPTATKSYKVLCTIGGCKSDSSLATIITVIPKPTQPKITASNSSVCLGGNSVLTSTACTNGTLAWTSGLTGNSITVSPTTTKSYKVLCTINGCKSDSSLATTITVVPKPTQPKITASNSSICVGGNSVLTSTACVGGILTWTGGLTGSSITVSPTATKFYKVLCTINGCKSDSSLATTITVVPKPTQPKITASNSSICVGGNSVLTSTACVGGILTWTGGLIGSSITVSPTATKFYKVLCTIGSCKSDSSLATAVTVTSKPIQPKITAINSSICVGGNSVLTSTACVGGTLTWTDGLTGSSITVSPTSTRSYRVLCTINGCKSDSSLATTITVVSKPTQPKITASNSSICVGGSSVLTSTACTNGTLAWTGGLTGNSITVSPTATKSYKALCTINGCKSDSSLSTTITVVAKPIQPKITASNSSICVGGNSVLTSTACTGGILTWTGGLTGSSITVSPTATKSYKVLCTINGCKSDSSLATTITVTPKPNAPVISSNVTCTNSVTKQWDKTLKGNGSENIRVMLNLPDGGYIIGGENYSDITSSLDYWLVKTDAKGNKVWEKTFGGTKDENLASMLATADGGYVLLGISNSDISADKSEASRGTNDYWVIKVNANGTKVWDKTFGGNAQDTPKSIVATADGGFILGGQSLSGLSGDKTEASKGTYDYWIVKINANGSKVWDKTFGGDNEEYLSKILIITDGGYLLGGYSSSGISGNKSETSKGASDYWIVKINANGSKVWDKTFGGNSVEYLGDVSTTSDGGFLLAGDSYSGLSGDKTEPSKGDTDYWVVKVNANGLKIWDKTFGGNSTEYFKAIGNTNDGGYILAGYSFSGISGEKSEVSKGNSDYWTVKIDANGVKVWDKAFGGNNQDLLSTIIVTNDEGFLLGGISWSGLSGDKTDVGTQYQLCWIVKASVCNPNNISSSQKPTLTATGCTGTVTWSNGATGNSITVSPSTATTYTATCTVNGCVSTVSNSITVSVTVTKPTTPTITVSNATICPGTNATLTASACTGGTLTWTGGLTGNSITVSPTATKTYKVVCSQNGISSDSSAAVTVTVNPKPTQPKITVSNATVCAGGSAVLSATACSGGTLTWTGGLTGASITVSPTATKSYKAICAINGCKSDSSLATTVNVLAKPNAPTITSKSTTVSSVVKQWEKTYGGNWYDNLSCVVPTQDGGYLLGGNSSSNIISGEKSEDIVGGWIVKINADGNKIWDKAYKDIFLASNGVIGLRTIIPTSDGGFLLGATSINNTGAIDFWLIKIDAIGNRIWDRIFGGIAEDYLVKVISTSDGGFLIGGSSLSTGTNGYLDYLVVKVDVNGNKQWTKFYGGAGHETLSSIIKTSDGGYLLVGDSHSNIGGDKSENSKGLYSSDYWIVKIDANGTKMWDKTLGGDNYDMAPDVVQTADGGFLLGGSSRSSISGDKSENYRGDVGYDDFWIVKLDSKGTKTWDKTFGGIMNDKLIKIMTTPDGGFLLGGSSYSGISLDKSEETQGHWLIKIDANGKKVWDKTFGGIGTDPGIYDISPTSDGGYIFGGSSKSSNRQMDYWIVKIKENKTTTTIFNATGCTGTVTWSNGSTGNSITVSPSTATTYTATCTVNGCVSSVSNSIKVSPDLTTTSTGSMYEAARLDANQSKPDTRIEFKVFPNPATDELNVETDLDGEATFQLYNMIGQQVLESTFVKKTKIPLINLSKGSYFYLIQYQEYRKTGKVLLE